jgi:hypothetical protein
MARMTERPQIVICRLLAYERLDPTLFPVVHSCSRIAVQRLPLQSLMQVT